MDALSEALGTIEPATAKKQIMRYVPTGAQKILAAAGIRDEAITLVGLARERAAEDPVHLAPALGRHVHAIRRGVNTRDNNDRCTSWVGGSSNRMLPGGISTPCLMISSTDPLPER